MICDLDTRMKTVHSERDTIVDSTRSSTQMIMGTGGEHDRELSSWNDGLWHVVLGAKEIELSGNKKILAYFISE